MLCRFFFFQAEDGIRDADVTGVQTCALPIFRNNLSMLASMLKLQMRLQSEQAAKDAFSAAIGRVLVIANAHDHLLPKHGESAIDMDEYLTACCRNLADALRDVRPIAVNVTVSKTYLRSDKAVAVGLIVNELVTNA